MRTVYLDLETTGLDPRTDEILEIGILDDAGTVLVDSHRAINDCRATRAVWRYLRRPAARSADAVADQRSGR
jgi:DNA polymerase III epsilon subunit-like protein